jgi:hypothetical protein
MRQPEAHLNHGCVNVADQSLRVCLQIHNGLYLRLFSPESTSLCLGNIKRNIAQAKRGTLRGK